MARAGFWAIESHSIRFGRDGEWYSDGERIANRRIAQLFSRCLRRAPEGGFSLQMGEERAPVEVEDTPFVIRQIDGSPDEGFSLRVNDETDEPLDPDTLEVGDDNAFYCRIKQGQYEARLLRPAYYALTDWIRSDGGDGFVLECNGRATPIAPRTRRR